METGMRVGLSAHIEGGTAGGAPCSERPWLSILIPVYNVEPYLRDCLASLLPQLPPVGVEVILLDDASTDGSLRLCSEICPQSHPQVRLMRHASNAGLSAARNTMLGAARGDYIWFVDSDDEVMPGAVARLRSILDCNTPDLLLCDFRKLDKNVQSFVGPANLMSTDREALVRGIFASRRMHSWSKIARRELWSDDLRFPVGRCFEDMATTPFLALRARSFYYCPEPWIRYRVRAESITGIMSRTRGRFDDSKNRDVATALTGFVAAARGPLPNLSDETLYCIAQFWAKEFTKLCWRLLSARFGRDRWADLRAKARDYRGLMEERAPMPFAVLNQLHLRRGKPGRWAILGLCLFFSRSETRARGSPPRSA